MRNLTIKRTKSFIGCLVKMKAYIEDPYGDLTINGVVCRKIGEIKNGEEKTFQIGDNEAKVFMIADKISKDYCNEYYQLPAGEYDIYLSGKNKYNPANGNAFRFDNNQSAGIDENRKKGTKKGLVVLSVSIIIGAIVGYFIGSGIVGTLLKAEPKEFMAEGMKITLTDDFRVSDIETNQTVVYESQKVGVFALKEAFADVEELMDYTLEEYVEVVLEANELTDADRLTHDGLTGWEYTYTNPDTNETFRYYSYAFRADDAFWLIQFVTPDVESEKYAPQIAEWAGSVEFSK